MSSFKSGNNKKYGQGVRERIRLPKVSREKIDGKKIFKIFAVVFLVLAVGGAINAWITRTTWEEYHRNPEDSLSSQFDYVEVYPGSAGTFGPFNPESNWGYHGSTAKGGYDSYMAEKSCVSTIELRSLASDNEEDRYEVVLWYGMEYRDNEWVVTASTYKPFKNGEMRLLECHTKDGVAQRVLEFDKK